MQTPRSGTGPVIHLETAVALYSDTIPYHTGIECHVGHSTHSTVAYNALPFTSRQRTPNPYKTNPFAGISPNTWTIVYRRTGVEYHSRDFLGRCTTRIAVRATFPGPITVKKAVNPESNGCVLGLVE